jgi:Holliday junction DNA helicase RuvA
MIAQLTGTVRHLASEKVVLDVGGVGYAISLTPRSSAHLVLGSVLTLSTTLIVREDSLTLFGFLDHQERDIFEILQSVSGIGPKVALAITGALTPEQLATAIASEDVKTIEKVPGIGKKGAQRLILELKGKLVSDSAPSISVAHHAVRDQLLSALTGLGFSAKESDIAINATLNLLAEEGSDPSNYPLADLLKLALQSGKR